MQGKFTISDIKAANAAAGLQFFTRETMRFFNSRVERGVYQGDGGVYLVTSEQFVGSDGVAASRRYTVRRFDPATGKVHTHGEYNNIARLDTAREMAKLAAKGGKA